MAADLRGVSHQLMAWEVTPTGAEMPRELAAALAEREKKPKRTTASWWLSWGATIGFVAVCVLLCVVSLPRMSRSRFKMAQNSRQMAGYIANPASSAPASQGRPTAPAARRAKQQQWPAPQVEPPQTIDLARTAPMIARGAQLSLTTKDLAKTREALEEIPKRHKGHIGQLSVNGHSVAGPTP